MTLTSTLTSTLASTLTQGLMLLSSTTRHVLAEGSADVRVSTARADVAA